MTIFWLILAAVLMFYGRFGTDRIKDDNWAEVAFRASQIAMLGCIGLAFFSLFDPPARSTPPIQGPGADFWSTIGWLVAVLVGLWVIGALVISSFRRRRLSRDELATPKLTLSLNRSTGMVLLTERGSVMVHRVPLGRLVVDLKPYDEDGAKCARVRLSEWTSGKDGRLYNPQRTDTNLKRLVEVDTYINNARDIVGWIRRHPGVELDAAAVRQTWDQACQDVLRFCRGQKAVDGAPALELWSAADGPSLSYAVVGKDGRVFAGMGEHPVVEAVTMPLMSRGRRLSVPVGGSTIAFDLTDREVGVVQALHAKGLVTVVPGL